MSDPSGPVFVFESEPPWHVVVYASIADAAGSVESLDVTDADEAFTVTGQIIRIIPTPDLFAHLQLTGTSDPARLSALLRRAPGPAHLADSPGDYASDWLREDPVDARRSALPDAMRRLRVRVKRLINAEERRDDPTRVTKLKPCPCCGYRTLPERDMYELCPVCFWEDDPNQSADPRSPDGANGVSLVEAQQTYLQTGAMHSDFLSKVRRPKAREERDSDWLPYE